MSALSSTTSTRPHRARAGAVASTAVGAEAVVVHVRASSAWDRATSIDLWSTSAFLLPGAAVGPSTRRPRGTHTVKVDPSPGRLCTRTRP